MKRFVAASVLLVAGAQLIALASPDRRLVLTMSGVALGFALLAMRWMLVRESLPAAGDQYADDAAKALRRWRSRTETLISRSDTTRTDWDRHLRPMLARQYELATGQKRIRDRAAYQSTGEMLFGTELWAWVDPENVSRTGATEPGPGRAALDEILQRLEQV
ncbi:hypothetical protein [Mycolicibacterium sp. XJ1819]